MSDIKQVCVHFMSGNCKYGNTCTKLHINPTIDILQEIEKKGPIICNYYPNCKFNNQDCKKLHITIENQYEKDIIELKNLYFKIMNYDCGNNLIKQNQKERIKFLIKSDIDMLKDTWMCLSDN